VIGFVVIPLLYARLLKWEIKRLVFWIFLFLPLLLLYSSVFFFLFLEADVAKYIIGVLITICTWLYCESIFTFYHIPSNYQAYTLEYLSLTFSMLSAFFLSSAMYARGIFLQQLIWVPALVFGLFSFISSMIVLWVSKVSFLTGIRYSLVCAICMAESYIVFSMLPTSFLSNAAGFTVILYAFLGIFRAKALDKLSKKVLSRYLLVSSVLITLIFLTARWI